MAIRAKPNRRPLLRQDGLRIYRMKTLTVELSTPEGPFFAASSSSIDVRAKDGCFHVGSGDESFLNMIDATEITCRTPDGTHVFELSNAVAGMKGRSFTVLAERIRRIDPDAVPEPES